MSPLELVKLSAAAILQRRVESRRQAGLLRVLRARSAALRSLVATARTFRNVPKNEQEWTSIDDDALDEAFAALATLDK